MVVKAKATKVSEVLGGESEEYYGVCDYYSNEKIEYIVG